MGRVYPCVCVKAEGINCPALSLSGVYPNTESFTEAGLDRQPVCPGDPPVSTLTVLGLQARASAFIFKHVLGPELRFPCLGSEFSYSLILPSKCQLPVPHFTFDLHTHTPEGIEAVKISLLISFL